jgi:hypothetical protein
MGSCPAASETPFERERETWLATRVCREEDGEERERRRGVKGEQGG